MLFFNINAFYDKNKLSEKRNTGITHAVSLESDKVTKTHLAPYIYMYDKNTFLRPYGW